MTRYEHLTIWLYGTASLSLICFFAFGLSMLSISLGDITELSIMIKVVMWRLGSAVIGANLIGSAIWLYKKREKELYRY